MFIGSKDAVFSFAITNYIMFRFSSRESAFWRHV